MNLRTTVAGAFWAQALLGGCALSVPHIDGLGANPCTATQQCSGGAVCFLGECRGRSNSLGTVLAEVHPPSSAPYGTVQKAGLDMHSSVLNDFELGENRVSGTVSQQSSLDGGTAQPVANAQVTYTSAATIIPGRPAAVHAQTASTGAYAAILPVGNEASGWQVEVVPPPPQPPLRLSQSLPAGSSTFDIALPAANALLQRSGTATQGGVPLSGAQVLAVDAQSQKPIAAPATVDAQGNFTLVLPPNPPNYLLRVSGASTPAGSGSTTPVPSFAPVGPFSAGDVPTAAFAALPPAATLAGQVVDARGSPVGGTLVYASSLDGVGWQLIASAPADSTGAYRLNLLTAHYAVEAAPPTGSGSPALSGVLQPIVVAAGIPALGIVCPPKVSAQGVVLRPDGAPAGAGTQIAAMRVPDALVSERMAQVAPTDPYGGYVLAGDPGEYRVHFLPPASSGLPRRVVALTLAAASTPQSLPPVTLDFPVEAVGSVRGPGLSGAPVPGATVEFFSLDQTGTRGVLIGSGVTDSSGAYRAVLPDATNPTRLTP